MTIDVYTAGVFQKETGVIKVHVQGFEITLTKKQSKHIWHLFNKKLAKKYYKKDK